MTDQNYEELRARLDALEIAVATVARLDRDLLLELQRVFTHEFQLAFKQAAQEDRIDMGQMRMAPKPTRNREREQARVNELRRLGRMFGAGL
ncbi:hypothetical protein LGN22_26790 [Burkholderia cenocepacia]|uniref:Uncharacterized protein n=1 Tax=Burkholderia cenocepacia TaxID=95486 RepID=A0AAW4TLA5_9BURK|nr:hypothetical protein [Burkholderia cenocepacia]MCA8382517.1 hypothetical protein [Burkholderia cenocepacia]